MTFGLEVVGLVLALFPVAIHAVETYRNRLKSDDLSNLALSLRNRGLIFQNATEELLSIVFTDNELPLMLDNPTGRQWKEESFTRRLTEYLGNDANELFETASRISKTIKKLNAQLPPLLKPAVPNSRLAHVKKFAKIFLKGSEQKTSLTSLANLVDEFCTLIHQNLRLAPTRRIKREPFKRLLLHHTTAGAVYAAIQNGLDCKHDHHIINLRLESWTSETDWTGSEPNFTFLCSLLPVGKEGDVKDEWQCASVAPRPSADSDDTSESEVAIALPVTRPLADNGGDIIDDLCDFLAKQAENEKAGTRSGYLTDENGQQFIVSTDKENEKPGSPVRSYRLSTLHEVPDQDNFSPTRHLRHIVPGFSVLTIAQRINLALTLAMSIVRLQPTHWIEHHWTSEHICLINRPTDRLQPYITHSFQPSQRSRRDSVSSTLSLVQSHREKPPKWIKNEALFNLCIVLIELCYGVPIELLKTEEDKDSLVMTALRLAHSAENSFGVNYQSAILGCLQCKVDGITADSSPEEREQFQRTVFQNIIQPLQDSLKVFAKS